MYNKLIPYNTGRVKIGIRYVAHSYALPMDDDALLLQRALLNEQSDVQKIVKYITNKVGAWL